MLPRIAIIDENTLEAVGLKTMLDTIVPMVEVSVFSSFEVFQAEILPPPGESKGAFFVHFFVSPRILMANSQFFIEQQRQTIVLTSKEMSSPSLGHYITLDTSQSEHDLVKAMLALHKRGHANPDGNGFHHPGLEERNILGAGIPISKREAEVLALVARGFINKEIAHLARNCDFTPQEHLRKASPAFCLRTYHLCRDPRPCSSRRNLTILSFYITILTSSSFLFVFFLQICRGLLTLTPNSFNYKLKNLITHEEDTLFANVYVGSCRLFAT